jgi:hypothetical protein
MADLHEVLKWNRAVLRERLAGLLDQVAADALADLFMLLAAEQAAAQMSRTVLASRIIELERTNQAMARLLECGTTSPGGE